MPGHRRISTRLFDKYRNRPALTHLLLSIDLDRARGRIRAPSDYERGHPVTFRTAKRLIAEYLEHLGDLAPKAARSGAHGLTTEQQSTNNITGSFHRESENLRETGRARAGNRPADDRAKDEPPPGLAQSRAGNRPADDRRVLIQNESKNKNKKKSAPAGARTFTNVNAPKSEARREKSGEIGIDFDRIRAARHILERRDGCGRARKTDAEKLGELAGRLTSNEVAEALAELEGRRS